MKIQNKVHSKALTGYRKPSESETKQMYEYLFKSENRVNTKNMLMVFVIFLQNLSLFIEHIVLADSVGGWDILTYVVMPLLVVLIVGAFAWKALCSRKALKKIRNSEFQVLDCLAWHADPDPNGSGGSSIQICHDDEYCEDYFLADINSLELWKENDKYPFTLLRCDYKFFGNRTRYELFSESKLKTEPEKHTGLFVFWVIMACVTPVLLIWTFLG